MSELYHPSIYRAENHVESYWAESAGPMDPKSFTKLAYA